MIFWATRWWCFQVTNFVYNPLAVPGVRSASDLWMQVPVLEPPLPGAGDPLLRPLQPAQVLRVHHGLPPPEKQLHVGNPCLQLRGIESSTQKYQVRLDQ